MIVKLPTNLYKKIRNLKRRLATLEKQNMQLKVKQRRMQPPAKKPKLQKLPKQANIPARNVDLAENQDPGKERTEVQDAQILLRDNKISPRKHPNVVKHLAAFNTLSKQIASAPKKLKLQLLKKKHNNSKSRCASHLAQKLKMNRRAIFNATKTSSKRAENLAAKRKMVLDFLKKPENSTQLPGKKDALSKGIVKYTLNETLTTLHARFMEENPEAKISKSTFCQLRPHWMKPIKWASRRQCLCLKHANGTLLLQAIHQNSSVDEFLKHHTDEEILAIMEEFPEQEINVRQWQKEDVTFQDKILKKVRLNKLTYSKETFVKEFVANFNELRNHVRRVSTQYFQLRLMKQNLPPLTEVSIHMDYAENYICSFQDEPSQLYYDKRPVTIHPFVVHYTDEEGNSRHLSYCGVSEEMNHFAPTTFAFLQKLIPIIKEKFPELRAVHYISDSPASQYRNKTVVKLLSKHAVFFPGITGSWDYLEVGHGKGPCDGIGGSLKHSADIAVKRGHVISNAKDFFRWTQEESKNITCFYVTSGEVKMAERKLHNATYVKGLSVMHSLRVCKGIIFMRETSCYNECCKVELTCDGWQNTQISVTGEGEEVLHANGISDNDEAGEMQDIPQEEEPIQISNIGSKYSVGAFVKADYEGVAYIGQIQEYSESENDYRISFMKLGRKGVYIWPTRKDETWVLEDNIISQVQIENGKLIS